MYYPMIAATIARSNSWYEPEEDRSEAVYEHCERLAMDLEDHPSYDHDKAMSYLVELCDKYDEDSHIVSRCKEWLDELCQETDLRIRAIIRQMEHHPLYERSFAYDFVYALRSEEDDSEIIMKLVTALDDKGEQS